MSTTTIDVQNILVHELDDIQRGLIIYLAAEIAEDENSDIYVCDQLTDLAERLTNRSDEPAKAEVMRSRDVTLTVFEDLEGNEHVIAVPKDQA